MRSYQVKEFMQGLSAFKREKEMQNEQYLVNKFNSRVNEMKSEKTQVNSEIENLEAEEKALMEQLSRTTQKRDEKMHVIRQINQTGTVSAFN